MDLSWKDGRLTTSTIRSTAGNPVRLRYGNATKNVKAPTVTWNGL